VDRLGPGPEQGYRAGQDRDYRHEPGYVPGPGGNQPTEPIDDPYGRRSRRY
jgi:hypothetical protein